MVLSDCIIIDENENKLEDSFFQLRNSKPGFIRNLIINSYMGCCMAFNRKILEKALPFPKNIAMYDMWIGIIAEVTANVYFIKDKLVLYNRHDYNLTPLPGKSKLSFFHKIYYRLIFLYLLIKRILFE